MNKKTTNNGTKNYQQSRAQSDEKRKIVLFHFGRFFCYFELRQAKAKSESAMK
jgi:hypothetical protein